jgi:glycosyltransferase involved in cell wall biosynthesis
VNILLVARSLGIGGAERQITALALGLADRGHAVTVAVFYEEGHFLTELRKANVNVISLGKTRRWDLLAFVRRFRQLVRQIDPSVVYSFLTTPNVAAVLATTLMRRPIPRIVWGSRASDVQLARYGTFERITGFAERVLSSRADAIVCNAWAGLNHLASRGFNEALLHVVWNGVDSSAFVPDIEAGQRMRSRWGIDRHLRIVGVVGRLDPMKDHETFLRSAAALCTRRDDVRFVMVGAGPLRMHLEDRSSQLGLREKVLWLGGYTDMRSVYNALDVLCLPSAWGEGFPNVIGEAMACGVPVVTTDVGDAAIIVGDLGLVVPPGDVAALSSSILAMVRRIEDGSRPPREALRDRVITEFNVDRMVAETEAVLSGG